MRRHSILVRTTSTSSPPPSVSANRQRRRLDVAIGLIGRPELLFLDEPTAGFDPKARRDFHDLVHRLSDLEDTTILLTTHDLDEAEKLADRILMLTDGRIVANGSADQLARQIAGQAEVRWTHSGKRYVHAADDATGFVRELFAQYGDEIAELEVRRASLEEHLHGDGPPAGGRLADAADSRTAGGGAMNPTGYAVRLGLSRGWIQFRQMMTSPDGIANTVIWNGVPLGILILMRNGTFEGSPLPLATVAMPGILGFMVASAAMGVAYYLAADREDGTLLRAKAVPNGMAGYMTGLVVATCLETAVGVC